MKIGYLLLDIGTVLFPMLLSFDKNVQYYKKWKYVFLASLIISVPFIIWDVFFTGLGVWGFNSEFLTEIQLSNLPIEEIIFFFVVPFACIFIYECCKFYFREVSFRHLNNFLVMALIVLNGIVLYYGRFGLYTMFSTISFFLSLMFWMMNKTLKYIGVSFFLSMIPFLLMNGVLTGGITENPIVWYYNMENSGLRLYTIPFEDILYSFSLIVSNIIVFELLQDKLFKKNR